MPNNQDLKYWVAFSQMDKIGPVRFQKLIRYFKDLSLAWQANLMELMAAGIDENIAHEIIIFRSQINPDEQLAKLEQNQISVVAIDNPDYPPLLKQIFDPPALLYYRGSLNALKNSCLAVVGTRKFSDYGKAAAQSIVGELAQQKITIVSGLALGIDAIAHQAAIDNDEPTVAILGSGPDKNSVYPSTNRALSEKIIEQGGAVISEHFIGTPPLKQNFPLRNRIISGLSLGTLVIEAKESSGSLITTKYALDQNRQVFAVPGGIFNKNSIGTNNLIKQGAVPVTSGKDILEALNLQQAETAMASTEISPPANSEEILILDCLSQEPTHIDKLASLCKLKINALSGILMIMEMKGLIKDLGGKNYISKKSN